MEIRIRLPGLSPASDLFLAPLIARTATAHALGLAAPQTAPPGTANPCAANPDCTFVGVVVDEAGKKWLVYRCDGVIELYPA